MSDDPARDVLNRLQATGALVFPAPRPEGGVSWIADPDQVPQDLADAVMRYGPEIHDHLCSDGFDATLRATGRSWGSDATDLVQLAFEDACGE